MATELLNTTSVSADSTAQEINGPVDIIVEGITAKSTGRVLVKFEGVLVENGIIDRPPYVRNITTFGTGDLTVHLENNDEANNVIVNLCE